MIRFVVEGVTDIAFIESMLDKPEYSAINNDGFMGFTKAKGFGGMCKAIYRTAYPLTRSLRADQAAAIIVVCDSDGVENRANDLSKKIKTVIALLERHHPGKASNIEFYSFIAERDVEAWMLAEGEAVSTVKMNELRDSNQRILARYDASLEAENGSKSKLKNILQFPKFDYDSKLVKRIGEEMTFDPAINASPSFHTFHAGLEKIIARIKVANTL